MLLHSFRGHCNAILSWYRRSRCCREDQPFPYPWFRQVCCLWGRFPSLSWPFWSCSWTMWKNPSLSKFHQKFQYLRKEECDCWGIFRSELALNSHIFMHFLAAMLFVHRYRRSGALHFSLSTEESAPSTSIHSLHRCVFSSTRWTGNLTELSRFTQIPQSHFRFWPMSFSFYSTILTIFRQLCVSQYEYFPIIKQASLIRGLLTS